MNKDEAAKLKPQPQSRINARLSTLLLAESLAVLVADVADVQEGMLSVQTRFVYPDGDSIEFGVTETQPGHLCLSDHGITTTVCLLSIDWTAHRAEVADICDQMAVTE